MRGRFFLLALPALLAAQASAAPAAYEVFPLSHELFHRLLADPRQIQLSAAYYRLEGNATADMALGHSWGMARWYTSDQGWAWQWDIEAMAYSRFRLKGAKNDFETVDFFGNLPLEVRHGPYSGKFMLFHESSHLGDDFIRRTGSTGFRYSIDGLRAVLSAEPLQVLRLYGGGAYLLRMIPARGRGALQWGLELTSPELGLSQDYPTRVYLAQDFQSLERTQWNVNFRTVLGLHLGFKGVLRSMRIHIGYFDGHSPYGQFFAQRQHYADVGISFDL